MTVKSDAKFDEKLTFGSKNDMSNLVNFDGGSGKCENLHFDVLLLSIASAKKVKKNSLMTLKKDPNFEEKLIFYLKNEMRGLLNFNLGSGKSEKCTLMGYFCRKH